MLYSALTLAPAGTAYLMIWLVTRETKPVYEALYTHQEVLPQGGADPNTISSGDLAFDDLVQ